MQNGVDFQMLKDYMQLSKDAGELAAKAKRLRAEAALLEDKLVEQFATAGVQNMSVDGKTVYLRVDKYANAKADNRAELVAWAREHDLDDMIVLQPARFKSWCREHIEESGELPAEISEWVNLFETVKLLIKAS